ncbi:MAG: DUF3822 family protein [Bacteroidales bacterium]|nr:DUF3822 family protein [Bacteroidales bacterium]
MSRHTPKAALVPSAFFDAASAREILSRTVLLDKDDKIEYISLPEFSAELVYSLSMDIEPSEGSIPELYNVLKAVSGVAEHNKIVASYGDGILSLAIAQGNDLLLANVFEAADFTTAEYFIFMAVRKLQLNPEVSTIHFLTPLSSDEEMSLYRYFRSVEQP